MAAIDIYEIGSRLKKFKLKREDAFAAVKDLAAIYFESTDENEPNQQTDNPAIEHCFHIIASQPELLVMAIGYWLVKDEFLPLGRKFLHVADVEYLQHFKFLDIDLSSLHIDSAMLAGYRLCAFGAAPAIALSWIIALSRDFTQSKDTKENILVLADFHAREFPRSTLEILSNKQISLASTLLAVSMRLRLEVAKNDISMLPDLRELRITSEMKLLLSGYWRRQRREIDDKAESKSIFASIFTTHYFKYANRTAMTVHQGDEAHETSMEMGKISISIERALSEISDPLRSYRVRSNFYEGPK